MGQAWASCMHFSHRKELLNVVGSLWWHFVSSSLAQHIPSWSHFLLVFCTFDTFSGSIVPCSSIAPCHWVQVLYRYDISATSYVAHYILWRLFAESRYFSVDVGAKWGWHLDQISTSGKGRCEWAPLNRAHTYACSTLLVVKRWLHAINLTNWFSVQNK